MEGQSKRRIGWDSGYGGAVLDANIASSVQVLRGAGVFAQKVIQ
jgi:hypothetical protein